MMQYTSRRISSLHFDGYNTLYAILPHTRVVLAVSSSSLSQKHNMSGDNGFKPFPGFATKALHVGQEPEQWKSMAVVPPISLSTTFKQEEPGKHAVSIQDHEIQFGALSFIEQCRQPDSTCLCKFYVSHQCYKCQTIERPSDRTHGTVSKVSQLSHFKSY